MVVVGEKEEQKDNETFVCGRRGWTCVLMAEEKERRIIGRHLLPNDEEEEEAGTPPSTTGAYACVFCVHVVYVWIACSVCAYACYLIFATMTPGRPDRVRLFLMTLCWMAPSRSEETDATAFPVELEAGVLVVAGVGCGAGG